MSCIKQCDCLAYDDDIPCRKCLKKQLATMTAERDRLRKALELITHKAHCMNGEANLTCRLGVDDPNEYCLYCIARQALAGKEEGCSTK